MTSALIALRQCPPIRKRLAGVSDTLSESHCPSQSVSNHTALHHLHLALNGTNNHVYICFVSHTYHKARGRLLYTYIGTLRKSKVGHLRSALPGIGSNLHARIEGLYVLGIKEIRLSERTNSQLSTPQGLNPDHPMSHRRTLSFAETWARRHQRHAFSVSL